MGSVLHKLQEDFYLGSYWTSEPTKEQIEEEFAPYADAWIEEQDRNDAMYKIAVAFNVWKLQFGESDMREYEILHIEDELCAVLPNGVNVSGRMDRVMRRLSDNAIVLFDTKTTSWSPESAHEKVLLADQVTMYTWLLQQKMGDVSVEMQPDICYLKPRVPTCHRYAPIYRSKADVESFVLGLTHDYDRLLSDLKRYEDGEAPAEYLFPRHSTVCSEFGCPFKELCRARLDESSPPPITGYVKKTPLRWADLVGDASAYHPIVDPPAIAGSTGMPDD